MSKEDRVIRSGPFKGKRIEFASTEVVDMFRSLAEEFMEAIFGMEKMNDRNSLLRVSH